MAMIVVILVVALNADKIYSDINDFFNKNRELVIPEKNNYVKANNYKYISYVEDFKPQSYQDLINIFYTVINNGWEEFTFYCPDSYKECLDDVSDLSFDEVLLSHLNNFVHPYNSYSTIKTLYDKTGEVTIIISHLYNKYEIQKIDPILDEIISNNVESYMTDVKKIEALHNYIINNTKYDTQKVETEYSPYDSSRIQGVLFDNYAICSGYTDTMAVLLNKLGITNYKISSDTHVWNAVYLDGEWLHLDLTWDDPVTSTNKDIINYEYFLINSNRLASNDGDAKDHIFDRKIYLEFN